MRSNYKRLGPYIQEVNIRNTDLSVDKLLGVSIQKILIPSIANIIGTDMTTYKVVKKGQFAYGPVTSRNGDKISIALLEEYDSAIISQSYKVFEIIDETELLPEYLMMWFRRPEFDRYARFMSHGSTRETFDWEEMCTIELPIPSIEKQHEIVKEYNTIVNRINLNEQLNQKLEETAQALYKHWFVDFEFPIQLCQSEPVEDQKLDVSQGYKSSGGKMVWCEELDKEIPEGWSAAPISDFGKVITGKTPSSNNPEDFGDEIFFITPGDFKFYNKFALISERKLSKIGFSRLSNKVLSKGAIIVTCIGSDMGKIAVANKKCITNQQMNSINGFEKYYTDYLYHHLTFISDEIKGIAMGSSTMPMLNKTDFEKILLLRPKDEILQVFDRVLNPINDKLINLSTQTERLSMLRNLLLSKMTKVEVEKETIL